MEDVIKKTEEVLFHPHQCHRQHPLHQLKIIALPSQLSLDFHYIVLMLMNTMEINRGIMNMIVVIVNILARSHPQGSPANEHYGAPPRKP